VDRPTDLTLAFSPGFGAAHWDLASGGFLSNPKGGLIIRDGVANRVVVFHPMISKTQARTTFEIGRHPTCWLKIGWYKNPYSGKFQEVADDRGYPLMNYFPRITLTFQWMDASRWSWVGESAWFVIPGGVFMNKDGVRERSGANLDVYLNGALISSEGNPEPLFPGGSTQTHIAILNRDVHSKHDVPYAGKMIVIDGALDKHTTGWPASIWDLEGYWPAQPKPQHKAPEPEALEQNAEIEEAIAQSKETQNNRPWYAAHLEAAWAWFTSKNTTVQLIILVLVSAGAALVVWAWD
jgi:hypothetical protein